MSRLLLVSLLLVTQAAFAGCAQFFPLGKELTVPDAVELCNSFYAVEYDTARNAPIVSVEKYRPSNHTERSNDFHPDLRLDVATRAERSDYLHSGYDQGHLTPAADATDPQEMRDTFLLSNMTPQEPTLNRKAWRLLEIRVRNFDPDYVATGAIYQENPKTIGPHHVPVPVGYYKIAYKAGAIDAWYADNLPDADVRQTTVEDIEQKTGLHFPRYAQ